MRSFAIGLLAVLAAAHAYAADISVSVSAKGANPVTQVIAVDVGGTTTLDLRRGRYNAVGGCAHADGDVVRATGEGRTGLLVEVTGQSADDVALGASVHVYSADLLKLMPMRAGACDGQTPALVKWDATASFRLVPGEPQTFEVGDVKVVVVLAALPRPAVGSARGGGFAL